SGPKSVEELSELLKSSPGSVRRQLSRLRRDPALVQSLPASNPKRFTLTEKALEILSRGSLCG
ncbi:MAG: ArsR family transcriptional regulator, partial [Candidatus Bipolaricaulaceae bacterium]